MTYGKVIFLIVNGICAFVFLCDRNDPPIQQLFGFSVILKISEGHVSKDVLKPQSLKTGPTVHKELIISER